MIQFKPFVGKNISDNMTPNLNAFFKKSGIGMGKKGDKNSAHFKALQATAISFLGFCNNGSSNESTVPPIREGILRGSGSAFVEGVLVGDTKSNYPDGKPNKEFDTKENEAVIGYNTEYAARMHETSWIPGGATPSKQVARNSGLTADVGNKWIEKHIKADGNALLGIYADIYKKEMGL